MLTAAFNPNFSIRRTCGAIYVLTAHFWSFLLLFVVNSALLTPHSQQNYLKKCIRHHHKSK
jgi:hypothetical protein